MYESISVFTGLSRPVGGLALGRRDVADRLQQAIAKPAKPFQGGVLDSSVLFQGPCRWISWVFQRPQTVSAGAFS